MRCPPQVLLSGLTWEGVLSSWVLGTLTYSAFGPGGYAIVCAYFIIGSLVRPPVCWLVMHCCFVILFQAVRPAAAYKHVRGSSAAAHQAVAAQGNAPASAWQAPPAVRQPMACAQFRGLHATWQRGVLVTHALLISARPCHPHQVTKVKLEQKQREGIAEARSGRRSLVSAGACCGLSHASVMPLLHHAVAIYEWAACFLNSMCCLLCCPSSAGQRAGVRVCRYHLRRRSAVAGRPFPLAGEVWAGGSHGARPAGSPCLGMVMLVAMSNAHQVAASTRQCKPSPSLSFVHPAQVGFVASFASKLADTTSSEIGKAYGQTTYLVTTLQRVPRGTEGAVSAEGTAAGVVAAAAVAGMAVALGQASAMALCNGVTTRHVKRARRRA